LSYNHTDFSLFVYLLANAYSCRIQANTGTALARPQSNSQQPQTIFSCTPEDSSAQYEVHVLSMYEASNRRPPSAGNVTVNIVSSGRSEKPIVLVLASYEAVNWILNLPAGITISKVILVSTTKEIKSPKSWTAIKIKRLLSQFCKIEEKYFLQ